MKLKVVQKAFVKSVPVMAGYLVLGFGFGILLQNAGYGALWALAMSLFIYAGTMQYVGVELLAGGASLVSAIITTIMVNARHLFYSVSMIRHYKDAGPFKPYLIFALTDETYSLLSDGHAPEGENANLYRFLVSAFNQSYWVCGCMLGNLLGPVLPFSTKGIEFSMTALFVASFVEQWRSSNNHIPALAGLLGTLLCRLLFGAENFLIPAMLFIASFLLLFRKRLGGAGEDRP